MTYGKLNESKKITLLKEIIDFFIMLYWKYFQVQQHHLTRGFRYYDRRDVSISHGR